jgi:hypothetical protein
MRAWRHVTVTPSAPAWLPTRLNRLRFRRMPKMPNIEIVSNTAEAGSGTVTVKLKSSK